MSDTAHKGWQLGRKSHPCPPWYSPTLSARFGSDPLGDYCHSNHIGRRTCLNNCGLTFALPPTYRRGSDLPSRWGIVVLDGRWSQRQTRWLELPADHKMWEAPTWLCRRELLFDHWIRLPNHQTIQLLSYSRCLGHRYNQEFLFPGVPDFVPCTKLGPPPGSNWHSLSLILSPPAGSPWLQAHWLGQFVNSVGITNSFQSWIEQRDGIRHMRWEVRLHSEGSEASTPKRRPRKDPRPPIPAGIQDEIPRQHGCQEPRLESRLHPPAEVCDPPAQQVETRPMERDARIPRSWRPVAVEDDRKGWWGFLPLGESLS